MKSKGAEKIENLSSKLTLYGNYAVVKYEPSMSFHTLLKIYGISETRTDLVRSLLSGNGLIYNNDTLLLSNGSRIPTGKVIQMPKRVISGDILKRAETPPKNTQTGTGKTIPKEKPIYPLIPAKESKQVELSVRESFAILMSDPRARYIIYGGCAALVIMISSGVYVALTDDDTPTRSRAASEETVPREFRSSKKLTRYPAKKEEKPEIKITPKASIPLAKSPASSEPPITTLDPNKPVPNMSNVGVIAISEHSSREEIVRTIRAWNEIHSPQSNTKRTP